MITVTTNSAEETAALGERLGSILEDGDTLCLHGDLGTGKTALTQGIAKALGVQGYITSPTFTIVNEYKGRIPLYHFDVYRIMDPDEIYETGFDEYIGGNGVTVIEWAEIISDVLPHERIDIYIERSGDPEAAPDERHIEINFKGSRYSDRERSFSNENTGG